MENKKVINSLKELKGYYPNQRFLVHYPDRFEFQCGYLIYTHLRDLSILKYRDIEIVLNESLERDVVQLAEIHGRKVVV